MARRLAVLWLLALALASPASGAFGGSGRWLTYPDGRVFVPHGVNLLATRAPYFPSWFGEDDARLLAREGFTVVRLLFLPAALEPAPDAWDPAYLKEFTDRVDLLARYGIATVLALNQDDYAEACGGDGFPAWMVVGSCDDPWAPFWANADLEGSGLQDRYLDFWSYAIPRLTSGSLLGLDLLNEPQAPDAATLGAFWQRTVAAVSAQTGRLLFTEPGAPGRPEFTAPLPRGTGYETHLYCWPTLEPAFAGKLPSAGTIRKCLPQLRSRLRSELAFATRNGYPFFVGEFGASDELTEQRTVVDALGAAFAPWAVYAYTARLDSSGTPTQSLLKDDAKPASEANAKQAKLDALVVPYAVAIAGTPASWSFGRGSRVVHFRYAPRGGGTTVVFVPQRVYATGYAVAATGARVVSAAGAPWLRLRALAGAKQVSVTIAPGRGVPTRNPLQVGICGYDLRSCGRP
jgi:endoglycosylceramidase